MRFSKADVSLHAVLLSLAICPAPYTVTDMGDELDIAIRDDIGPKKFLEDL
jgi:hypothetical protein